MLSMFAAFGFRSLGLPILGFVLWAFVVGPRAEGQTVSIQGPGVNPSDFRVTTFVSGISFPLGMAELPDGSLLVSSVAQSNFMSGTGTPGSLIRLVDADANGIADDDGTTLYSGLPPTLTAVVVMDELVFVTGRPHPIYVFRLGANPADPLTLVGKLIITYATGWVQHRHTTLAVRRTPGFSNRYEVFFQLGAEANFSATTSTASLTNDAIPGATGTLVGDAIHMVTIEDDAGSLSSTGPTLIATGTRNAAGLAFHPVTGDLYFQDNGIDGVSSSDPTSADELNVIAHADVGGAVEFFGFPDHYTAYRTGALVGGGGVQPLIAFQPLPDPTTGAESEGPNQIAVAPPGFPDGLNSGVFLGFHGIFSSGGTSNNENPLVYADPATGAYFHFILGGQEGVGHLDGLHATRDALFVADLSITGNPFNGLNGGAIYQIKSLVSPSPPVVTIERHFSQLQINWSRGTLLQNDDLSGPWTEVPNAFAPFLITPTTPGMLYRAEY
jgi:hypothetical protein